MNLFWFDSVYLKPRAKTNVGCNPTPGQLMTPYIKLMYLYYNESYIIFVVWKSTIESGLRSNKKE